MSTVLHPQVASGADDRFAMAMTLDVPLCLDILDADDVVAAIARHSSQPMQRRADKTMAKLAEAHPDIVEYTDGGTRAVFHIVGTNSVVKVPYFQCDAQLNQLEVAYYEQGQYGHPVIPCRLVWTDTAVPLVVMERCAMERWNSPDLPDWGRYVDGWQIARSKLLGGRWAAYDAGWPAMDSPSFGKADGLENDYRRLVASALQLEGKPT